MMRRTAAPWSRRTPLHGCQCCAHSGLFRAASGSSGEVRAHGDAITRPAVRQTVWAAMLLPITARRPFALRHKGIRFAQRWTAPDLGHSFLDGRSCSDIASFIPITCCARRSYGPGNDQTCRRAPISSAHQVIPPASLLATGSCRDVKSRRPDSFRQRRWSRTMRSASWLSHAVQSTPARQPDGGRRCGKKAGHRRTGGAGDRPDSSGLPRKSTMARALIPCSDQHQVIPVNDFTGVLAAEHLAEPVRAASEQPRQVLAGERHQAARDRPSATVDDLHG